MRRARSQDGKTRLAVTSICEALQVVSSEVAGHEMMMRQQAGRLRYCFRLTIESKHKVPGNDEMTMQLENLYCFLDQVELTHSCPAVPVRASQILITGNWPCLEQIAGWTLDFKPLCLPTFRQRLIELSLIHI